MREESTASKNSERLSGNDMEVVFTRHFLSETKKLKKDLREELEKAVDKVIGNPFAGKPLKLFV